MLRCPLQEAEGCQFSQFREILYSNVGDVGRKSVFHRAYVGFLDICEIIEHTKYCFKPQIYTEAESNASLLSFLFLNCPPVENVRAGFFFIFISS